MSCGYEYVWLKFIEEISKIIIGREVSKIMSKVYKGMFESLRNSAIGIDGCWVWIMEGYSHGA